ncbi:MAG: SCO family protein [Pseudomonadota bacterium]
MKRALLWIVATTLLTALVLAGQFQRLLEPGPDVLSDLGYFAFGEPRALPSIGLVDHERRSVRLDEGGGQWTLVFFGFTACPDVCPTTLSIINLAFENSPDAPAVIMVTLDPERDTPDLLQGYVQSFNPHFRGLTGSPDAVQRLTDELHIAFEKVPTGELPGQYTIAHSGALVVLDPDGRFAGYIRPPLHEAQLREIYRTLADATGRSP